MADPTTLDGRQVQGGPAIPVVIENKSLSGITGATVDSPYVLNGQEVRTTITCALANTDYLAFGVIPADVKRILVYSTTYDAALAVGRVTTATDGLALKADVVYEFRVTAGGQLHARSATAGTVVTISYLYS